MVLFVKLEFPIPVTYLCTKKPCFNCFFYMFRECLNSACLLILILVTILVYSLDCDSSIFCTVPCVVLSPFAKPKIRTRTLEFTFVSYPIGNLTHSIPVTTSNGQQSGGQIRRYTGLPVCEMHADEVVVSRP